MLSSASQAGFRHRPFPKNARKRPAPRRSCGARNHLGQHGRALIQKPHQIARDRFQQRPAPLCTSARTAGGQIVIAGPLGVDHALINFLHRFQMRVQFVQQLFARRGAAELRYGHFARQQIQLARRGGQGVRLTILGKLQPVLQIAQEAIRGNQTRAYSAAESRSLSLRRDSASMVPPCRTHGTAAAVQALQALHQELDIADAARRQLDVERGFAAASAGSASR